MWAPLGGDEPRPYVNSLPQCLAFQALHHQERPTIVLANVVNRADVGMIERRGSARLAAETFQKLMILGKLLRQELERHTSAELRVLGLVDHAHAARTQLFNDAIVRNRLAKHGRLVHE